MDTRAPAGRKLALVLARYPLVSRTAKAYAAAYVYVVVPRIVSLLSRGLRKKESPESLLRKLVKLLRRALYPDRFPAFIAKLVGSTFFINAIAWQIVRRRAARSQAARRATFFVSAASSALIFFNKYKQTLKTHPTSPETLDLSLVTAVRAGDMVLRMLFRHFGATSLVTSAVDVSLFCISSYFIMLSWFYYPERLTPSYRKWITMAANMDNELVDFLKLLNRGKVGYGRSGPHDKILDPTCERSGLPVEMGRFANYTDHMSCLIVHQNSVSNCELHALWRFYRGFLTSLSIYVPLNALLSLGRRNLRQSASKIVGGSIRSSVFLATYITLNWYSVCLVRSRIGPAFFKHRHPDEKERAGPVLASMTCGLSSLVETAQRRGELMLFVAPKATEAVLPENFSIKHPLRETVIFALAYALLATGSREAPQNIRGFFRKLLQVVF